MPEIAYGSLRRLVAAIFAATGVPRTGARLLADLLVDSDLAGHGSHGVLRVPRYVTDVRAGAIDPGAVPAVVQETPTTALVTANWGFGHLAAAVATDVLVEKVRAHQVAAVSLVQTGHLGRLGAYTERAARSDVVMFMAVAARGMRNMAPYGGALPALGTNPVSAALPRGQQPPVTLDLATSAIAMGKIHLARAAGRALTEGVALDAAGNPTTDPDAVVDGGMVLPFGGHKGYALAVVAELLGCALGGADAWAGERPPAGAFMFGVKADAFRPLGDYQEAVAETVDRITSVPPARGFDAVRVPGDRSSSTRDHRRRHGVPVDDRTWARLLELAAELGVDAEVVPGTA